MVNTALSPTCTNHVLKIYSTLRNQFISKLGISKNNTIYGRFPSDSKRQWAGLKRNLFLGIRVCKCSFLTNSVMPIIYLMMFIQIFEVEIEDEFTRENTSKEEQKMGEHHIFFSAWHSHHLHHPGKIKDLLKFNCHDTLEQCSYFTNKVELIQCNLPR